jgi:hypothetical protein
MSAENELMDVYRDWLRLVQAENKAIQTRNWSLLAECHAAIRNYQHQVARLTPEARAEWQRAGDGFAEKESRLRDVVAELLELTRQNHDRLLARRAAARKQLDRLGSVGQNLKQIRRSYGYFPACSRAV